MHLAGSLDHYSDAASVTVVTRRVGPESWPEELRRARGTWSHRLDALGLLAHLYGARSAPAAARPLSARKADGHSTDGAARAAFALWFDDRVSVAGRGGSRLASLGTGIDAR